jgi:hypothetical protein
MLKSFCAPRKRAVKLPPKSWDFIEWQGNIFPVNIEKYHYEFLLLNLHEFQQTASVVDVNPEGLLC